MKYLITGFLDQKNEFLSDVLVRQSMKAINIDVLIKSRLQQPKECK